MIGEIERFQKDLEEKEKGVKEHAKLLDKRKEIDKSIQQVKEQLKVIADKKKALAKEMTAREEHFGELLTTKIAQRDQYLKIISHSQKIKAIF